MKILAKTLCVMALVQMGTQALAAPAEDWKGPATDGEFSVGGIAGMAIINSNVGFALSGTASKRIANPGFVADLNNTVHVEAELGPVFISGVTGFNYNAYLRWNFKKDLKWTFFALGGFGGNILGSGIPSQFYPRFGIGAMYSVSPMVRIRAQISHDLIAFGVNVPLG